nr:T9SS type A sorting domain-containing protein [Bacteroidota bacterium]
ANPLFYDIPNGILYPTNYALDNLGTPLGITTDLAGINRNMLTPDFGAYEFSLPVNDAKILNLRTAFEPCFTAGDTLKVDIVNTLTTPLNFSTQNLNIAYTISGASTASGNILVNSGTLAGGATTTVNLATGLNLSPLGTYNLTATLNATWDDLPFNNSINKEIIVSPVVASISRDTACAGTSITLTLTGITGLVQWEKNTGTGWNSIAGADSVVSTDILGSLNSSYRSMYCGNLISNAVNAVPVVVTAPTTINDTVCAGNPATLNATGPSTGTIDWYNAPTAGTIVGTGNTFTTTVSTTTTFYAESSIGASGFVGMAASNPIGTPGSGTGANYSISFDAISPFELNTITIYQNATANNTPGTLTIGLYNSSNVLLQSTVVNVIGYTQVSNPTPVTVSLNFNIAPGTGYKLAPISWTGISNLIFQPAAQAPAGGFPYPYTIPGVVSINHSFLTSTVRLDLYYYFYNWNIIAGCSSVSRTPAEIFIKPLPAISLPVTTEFCQGNPVILDPGTIAGTYLWSTSDVTQTISPNTAGKYIVTATGTNGCVKSDSTDVIINMLPVIAANATDVEVCDGTQVTLSGSGTGTGTVTYTWNHNVIDQVGFIPTSTETYTVIGKDAKNCESTDMVTVIVNPLPVVQATSTLPELCFGDLVTLTGSGAPNLSWDKNVADAVPFAPTTTEVYTVTGTDANNCSSTDSVTVIVNPLPMVEANVTSTTVCAGDQVTFTGSGADTYTWNNGVTDNVPFTPVVTLSYTVTGTDANNCINTDEITVAVNPLPIVTANATATAICFGGHVTLTGSGADTYSWNNNVKDDVAFNPATTLSYVVTGTDANNCSNTDEITITVNPLPDVTLENFKVACLNFPAFDLSGGNPVNGTYLIGGTNPVTSFNPKDYTVGFHAITYTYTDANGCTSSAQGTIEVSECVGIAETAFESGSVKVYPNPAFNQFTLEVNATVNEAAEIMVYNSNGKIVKVEKTNFLEGSNKIKFETSEFARGVYYIQILTNTGSVNQKVVLN